MYFEIPVSTGINIELTIVPWLSAVWVIFRITVAWH